MNWRSLELCATSIVRRIRPLAAVGIVLLVAAHSFGADSSKLADREWALLIGVSQYEKAPKLPYIDRDVSALSMTLQDYGGVKANHIHTLCDGGDTLPNKANIQDAIKAWLTKPTAGDTLILYFSGHGFRDSDGRLYLAPIECDPAHPTDAGIPVQWIREQLEACPATFKLLLIDACHAGAEKGLEDEVGVTAKDLGDAFKQSPGVVTLASSTGDEKSQLWEYKQQSLFSYWLKEGLKGHADSQGDGNVTLDELYEYVFQHVQETARVRLQRTQTPVRTIGPRTPGVPVVVELVPQGLKQVLADMADQLAGAMEERQIAKVGVLEFTNDTKFGELLGGNFGLLGKYCGDEIERKLDGLGNNKFAVIDRGRLLSAMKQQHLGVKDLSSSTAMNTLSKRVGGLPVVARGTLRDRAGRVVTLRCLLEDSADGARLSDVGGLAVLTDSEWAMIGRSVEIKPGDEPPPSPDQPPAVVAPGIIDRADERSEGPHPFRDPNFPYPIRIMVDGKERKGVFKETGEGKDKHEDYIVGLNVGEVYEIQVQSRNSEPFLMRLLVDGLNTLPEREPTKGAETYVWAKRVENLGDARPWVLDPSNPKTTRYDGMPTWGFRGFVTDTGEHGQLREFKVVDAEKSLAARQQFADAVGMITAAFYAPEGGTRAVGTDAGKERDENIKESGMKAGDLRAVVHIRYVETSALADETRKAR